MKNVLQLLEQTCDRFPNKIAFSDNKKEITFRDFEIEAKRLGSAFLSKGTNQPMAILLDKNVDCLVSMMAVVYSGNFYTVLDSASPKERLNLILDLLEPVVLITDKKHLKKAQSLSSVKEIILLEDVSDTEIDEQGLMQKRNKCIDSDPLYILFTSGSTGVPKGTVLSHKAVISYIEWFVNCFDINETTVFGSQTPFYFSMSVSDVFATIATGATFHIIPKMYFSFPVRLIQYMDEKKINTIYWVPSALCIVANLGALENIELKELKKILFAGEVMPVKQLNMWIEKFPDAMFANLFGPTETTDICTYYVVDRKFNNDESLPIGKSCDNCDVLIVNENNELAGVNEEGELLVRGSFLANGYYKNPEKTNSVFIQNPLNSYYPEIVYCTGDIVKMNENGEIIYLSRKDFQIKHMGYRIELGEIENAINAFENITISCCIYDEQEDKIVLFYQGKQLSEQDIFEMAKSRLPRYMCPNVVIQLDRIPYNANGKLDRNKLKQDYKGEK